MVWNALNPRWFDFFFSSLRNLLQRQWPILPGLGQHHSLRHSLPEVERSGAHQCETRRMETHARGLLFKRILHSWAAQSQWKGWAGDRFPSFLSSLVFSTLFIFRSASSPVAQCILAGYWKAVSPLPFFAPLFYIWFCFANTNSKNCIETLIQFVSSPKAPHFHRRTPQVFPELSDAENYCRNPGGEKERPWCYTKDPSMTWEYCSVSACADGRQLQCMISATVVVLETCKVFASWMLMVAPTCSVFRIHVVLVLFVDSFSIFTRSVTCTLKMEKWRQANRALWCRLE